MKKTLMTAAILMLGLTLVFVSCSKIEEAFNQKKDEVKELTDKTTGEAKDIIQEGKDEIKKGADELKK
jgi:hypothetical protein